VLLLEVLVLLLQHRGLTAEVKGCLLHAQVNGFRQFLFSEAAPSFTLKGIKVLYETLILPFVLLMQLLTLVLDIVIQCF
jgi:hypothetical protein